MDIFHPWKFVIQFSGKLCINMKTRITTFIGSKALWNYVKDK